MARSISEFDLYQDDDDKEYYLNLLAKYKEKYKCKVYGYCLMTNLTKNRIINYHPDIDKCDYLRLFKKCIF